MTEDERQAKIQEIAMRLYVTAGRDMADAVEQMLCPPPNLTTFAPLLMPEPTPYARGVLARYQDGQPRRRVHRRRP